jgi:hypothetical protein
MQTWEYKSIYRSRGFNDIERNSKVQWAGDWTLYDNDGTKLSTSDVIKASNELGKQGWELVAISPRSGVLSPFGAVAGFTSEEVWVFKRLVK